MRNIRDSKACWRGKARTADNEAQRSSQSRRALSGRLPVTEHLLRNADPDSVHRLVLDLCDKVPGIGDQVTTQLYFSQQDGRHTGQRRCDEQGRRRPPFRENEGSCRRPEPRVLKPIDRAGHRWLKSRTKSSADQPESSDAAGPSRSAKEPESRRAVQSARRDHISSKEAEQTQAGISPNSQESGTEITSKRLNKDQTDETINEGYNGATADCTGTPLTEKTRGGRSEKEKKRRRVRDQDAESRPETGKRRKRAKDQESEGETRSHKRGDAMQDLATTTTAVSNHGEGGSLTEKPRKSVKKHKHKHKERASTEHKKKKRHLQSRTATIKDSSGFEPPDVTGHSSTGVNGVDDPGFAGQENSRKKAKAKVDDLKAESSTESAQPQASQTPVTRNRDVVYIDLSEELDSVPTEDDDDPEETKILSLAAEMGVRMHPARIAQLKQLEPDGRVSRLQSLRTNDLALARAEARSGCHTSLDPAHTTTVNRLTRDLADQRSSRKRDSENIGVRANLSSHDTATHEPNDHLPYQQVDAKLQHHSASPRLQERPLTHVLEARSLGHRTPRGHQTLQPRDTHLSEHQHVLTVGPLPSTVNLQESGTTLSPSTVVNPLLDQGEIEQEERSRSESIASTPGAVNDQAMDLAPERTNTSLTASIDVHKQENEEEDYGYVELGIQSLDAQNEDVDQGPAHISRISLDVHHGQNSNPSPAHPPTIIEGDTPCETPDAKPRVTEAGITSPREPVRVRCVGCKKLFVPTDDLSRECAHHPGELRDTKWSCCGGRKDHRGCEQTVHQSPTPSVEL